MFRLNKLTDYSTVIMTFLARSPEQFFAARDIATNTRIALPTVSKILKQLGRAELLTSERGVQGGYRLAKAPHIISLAEVINAMEENRVAVTECSTHVSHCELEHHCAVRGNWQLINTAIRAALEGISLADLAGPMRSLNVKLHHKTIPITASSSNERS